MSKTIIENSTKLSKYLFADDKAVSMASDKITVGSDPVDFIIGDLNTGNATLHEDVDNAPSDWYGNKYKFDGTTWAANADFVDPRDEDH